jgi:hypothetical protein
VDFDEEKAKKLADSRGGIGITEFVQEHFRIIFFFCELAYFFF